MATREKGGPLEPFSTMREQIRALYYPEFVMATATLKRAVLLFDELHVMDRPSFSFGGPGKANFGMIGAASPFRQIEQAFRDEGMPLYVHAAPGGRISEEDYAEVSADISDMEFLRRFQEGLANSQAFRNIIIPPANYGAVGNQDDVLNAVLSVDLPAAFSKYSSPIELLENASVHSFTYSTSEERAKGLLHLALTCAVKLNLALKIGAKYGHQPTADATPYGDLLGAKYSRAMAVAAKTKLRVQISDLTFAVLDELMPPERLDTLTFADVLKYRKRSSDAREHFMEHMAALHSKSAEMNNEGDYRESIERIVTTEIRPAARDFQSALSKIDGDFKASLSKGVLGVVGGASFIQILASMSWSHILPLAITGAAYVTQASIDAYFADEAAKRESSLSYILSLD
jgi:hypothetical protein